MDHDLDELDNLSILGALEDTNTVLAAAYPIVTPADISTSAQQGVSSRGIGQPCKRYVVACRPKDHDANVENSSNKGAAKRRDWVRLVLKSRDPRGRAGRRTDKAPASKATHRAWMYGMAALICCLLIEVSVTGSVMQLLQKRSDIATSDINTPKQFHDQNTGKVSVEYNLKFVPQKFRQRYLKQRNMADLRKLARNSIRRPRLALVCASLEDTPESLYFLTLWKALEALGYDLELFPLKDGPMRSAWVQTSATVSSPHPDPTYRLNVDWLKFEGVILSSVNVKSAVGSLMQDPFKTVPVIWIIHEDLLARHLKFYDSTGLTQLLAEWRRTFGRADIIMFSEYTLPMAYSLLDTGNFFVLPGSPAPVWKAEQYMSLHTRGEVRELLRLGSCDILIVVVGSPFSYQGVWREHAIIMQAALPIARNINKNGLGEAFSLKLFFLSGNSSKSYGIALKILAAQIGLANDTISHFGIESDIEGVLWAADAVVYSSLHEEQSFPTVLVTAMSLGRPMLAPSLRVIRKHIQDGVHGILFRAGNMNDLTQAFGRVFSPYGMTDLAQTVASTGRLHARGLLAGSAVLGFAELLELVLQFPSETHLPLPVMNIPEGLKRNWQWQLVENVEGAVNWNSTKNYKARGSPDFVYEIEGKANKSGRGGKQSLDMKRQNADWISLSDWMDVKLSQLAEDIEQREEEQLDDRREQLHGTWEEAYRGVKKADSMKNELHERDDGELERTGQPICIYEPYFGVGAWFSLHHDRSLYRGISMILGQRRPGSDDIEASLRLVLLNDSYYRDLFCDFGAFLAIANRIDRIHKNSWIGFQSWQAAGRKISLSAKADNILHDVITRGGDGDTLYFWVSTGDLSLNSSGPIIQRDFWSYCDAINSGNCRFAFLIAFRRMYGLPSSWKTLPPMPLDGDRWSALHCWAMPTSSFLEFVMFARMFISALDSEFYFEHHDNRKCRLGVTQSEVPHCYCSLLELLVNVWAYHSSRRMIFVHPITGVMHEEHSLFSRHGHMWIKFFSYDTLKGMDEDLAEEADDGPSNRRWLWPHTGEVFCHRISERERQRRYALKLEKKKRDKERVRRIRSRHRQRPLANG